MTVHILKELPNYEAYEAWLKEEEKKKKPKKFDWRYPLILVICSSWSFVAGYALAIWK